VRPDTEVSSVGVIPMAFSFPESRFSVRRTCMSSSLVRSSLCVLLLLVRDNEEAEARWTNGF
jgi:hypothetical protein